ncbi:hypothetical protein M404DRAFT_917941 [Pisolithus tinctorius Marx 270]|uniref:Uncharacterized protein n=1 Tax=Pisolithus tinctorius Marx 270 TaxID=870435 RepID=A0A0C3JHZ5_PISTI|nr:hypothetical protein M404DRAFT_917941 [Pisolithus tinctorius Marx 270]
MSFTNDIAFQCMGCIYETPILLPDQEREYRGKRDRSLRWVAIVPLQYSTLKMTPSHACSSLRWTDNHDIAQFRHKDQDTAYVERTGC